MSSTQATLNLLLQPKTFTKANVLEIFKENLAAYDNTKGIFKKSGLRADTPIIQELRKFQAALQDKELTPLLKRNLIKLIMHSAEAGSATHAVLAGIRKALFEYLTPTQRLALRVLSENNEPLDNYFADIFPENEVSTPKPGLYACEHAAFRQYLSELTQSERHQRGHLSTEQFWNTLNEKEQSVFFQLYYIACVTKHGTNSFKHFINSEDNIDQVYKIHNINREHWTLAGVIHGKVNGGKMVAVSTNDWSKNFEKTMTEKIETLKKKGILLEKEYVAHYRIVPLKQCTLNWLERYKECEDTHKHHFSEVLHKTLFFPQTIANLTAEYDTLASDDSLQPQQTGTLQKM